MATFVSNITGPPGPDGPPGPAGPEGPAGPAGEAAGPDSISVFATEEERNAAHPTPARGQLSVVLYGSSDTIPTLEVWNGTAWAPLYYNMGSTSSGGIVAMRMSAKASITHVNNGGVGQEVHPAGTSLIVGDGPSGSAYIQHKFTDGDPGVGNSFFSSGSQGYLYLSAPPSDPARSHYSDFRLDNRDRTKMLAWLSNFNTGGSSSYWLTIEQNPDNRATMRVYGKIVSDNLPGTLLERLEAVEAALGIVVPDTHDRSAPPPPGPPPGPDEIPPDEVALNEEP